MLNSSKTNFYRKSTSKLLFRIIEAFIIDILIFSIQGVVVQIF
jgi:hypothetical protein